MSYAKSNLEYDDHFISTPLIAESVNFLLIDDHEHGPADHPASVIDKQAV